MIHSATDRNRIANTLQFRRQLLERSPSGIAFVMDWRSIGINLGSLVDYALLTQGADKYEDVSRFATRGSCQGNLLIARTLLRRVDAKKAPMSAIKAHLVGHSRSI